MKKVMIPKDKAFTIKYNNSLEISQCEITVSDWPITNETQHLTCQSNMMLTIHFNFLLFRLIYTLVFPIIAFHAHKQISKFKAHQTLQLTSTRP